MPEIRSLPYSMASAFMMTSEREWGCYATLPGVAIYQLTGRAGTDPLPLTPLPWH